MTTFQGGTIYWSAATRAHVLYGDIRAEYNATANERDAYGTVVQRILGMPTSDEAGVPGVPGGPHDHVPGRHHLLVGGDRAHVLYGDIRAEYNATANERDAYGTVVQRILGMPTSDEAGVPGVPGPA